MQSNLWVNTILNFRFTCVTLFYHNKGSLTSLVAVNPLFGADDGRVHARRGASQMDRPKLLIAVDRRQFSRGCLASWLISLGQEFEICAVADVDNALEADELA